MVRFVSEAFRSQTFSVGMNHSFITLIPKVDAVQIISQMRSISLTNMGVKIISKVIANRLKIVIGKLVSVSHSSFIPGRKHVIILLQSKKYFIRCIGRKAAVG